MMTQFREALNRTPCLLDNLLFKESWAILPNFLGQLVLQHLFPHCAHLSKINSAMSFIQNIFLDKKGYSGYTMEENVK